jgi:hypothetical protein
MPDDGSLVTRRPAQAAAELRELSLKPGIFIDEAEAVNRALNRTLISPRLVQRSGTNVLGNLRSSAQHVVKRHLRVRVLSPQAASPPVSSTGGIGTNGQDEEREPRICKIVSGPNGGVEPWFR